jgi:NAD(P)-dependent dehydrogenase (short-subunit alcohol dehydrogenase family)
MSSSGDQPHPGDLSEEDVKRCLKVLQTLAQRPELCDSSVPGIAAVRDHAARLLRASRQQQRTECRQRDRDLLDATGIRNADLKSSPDQEAAPTHLATLTRARHCYVCKRPYDQVHPFYDCLCPACGDFNYAKRLQSADLTGRVALITGGRVKIGFQTALKLLRAGASVVVTTRFRCDAARRFAQQDDFSAWSDRLQIHALDMRFLPLVEQFAAHLASELARLDVVINNAAQTVRRPPAYYRHLLEGEGANAEPLPSGTQQLLAPAPSAQIATLPSAALLTQLALLPEDESSLAHFPPGWYDSAGQQVDLRPRNSWDLQLSEVAPVELIEVHAVNCLAPFMLLRHLEPLLFRADGVSKYVVNVSGTEGQLSTATKSSRHPHTNMAKAALNMITRTCAENYAQHGVFMNSVDTGWISNEGPDPTRVRMAAEGFREPLDAIEAAARVLDPVFLGVLTGRNEYGKFWKDYRPVAW